MARKKSSRSNPNNTSSPVDDHAMPISEQSREQEQEWDQARGHNGRDRHTSNNNVRHSSNNGDASSTPRSRNSRAGLLNQKSGQSKKKKANKNSDEDERARDLERQLYDQQAEQKQKQSKSKSKKKGDPSSLGRFIGGKDGDLMPPIETRPDSSVAYSALTTPTALRSTGASVGTIDEEEESRKPLLPNKGKGNSKQSSNSNGRNNGSSTRHGDDRKKDPKRVGFTSKWRSTSSSRASSEEQNSDYRYESSALSMRKSGKRPWFSSQYGKSSTNSQNGNAGGGARSSYNAVSTGVPYRSATSTARALEELKRKRIETQEKRRAMSILAVLFIVAGTVHFAGSDKGGLFGALFGRNGGDGGMRGSRDKEYGETKDLGYGGERNGALLEQALVGQGGDGNAFGGDGTAMEGTGGTGDGEDYEYQLPPPVEKTYDPDHEFLLPLKHFADVTDPNRPSDAAYFFHVPRAGGSTFKVIIGKCLQLVQSSEVGVRDGHGTDPQLQVLEIQESQYVNVDTTTIPGIQRAVDLGLAASGLANVIVSSYLHESAALFDLNHQGRAIILLRDPVERATSMYWHRIKEVGDLESSTTIEDYAQGNGIENNWMCRFLTNRMTGELTKDDLEQAKEVLKEKFLIGFVDDFEESVYRIMKYNGWKFSTDETEQMKEEDCIKDLTSEGGGSNINPNEYEIPKRGSQAHALISWQTQFDSKLFAYAKELFDHQTKEWGTKERKKALKKEKKKKGS